MAARKKYDWDGWFDQGIVTLVSGVDYHCPQSTIAQAIRNNASLRRLRVSLTDTGRAITIEVVGEIPHPDKVTIFA